jgi:hypothetical protein
METLTPDEKAIIDKLADAFNTFYMLENKHPSDVGEFAHHIHILQRHVMARLARRTHPEIFPHYDAANT